MSGQHGSILVVPSKEHIRKNPALLATVLPMLISAAGKVVGGAIGSPMKMGKKIMGMNQQSASGTQNVSQMANAAADADDQMVQQTRQAATQHAQVQTGESMDLAWRLLKRATSPEALRHKREYDTQYESTPERVNYREELNAERRKRGIMGQGGPDMSHTKRGVLVAESPHANRARHFKERGTLKP